MKKVLIVLAVLAAVFVALGLSMSNEYRVARKVTIQADVARVHELCGDLKNWPQWAPWEANDKSIRTSIGEKSSGVGAYQSWKGDNDAGELTFTRCDPASGVAWDMNFINGDSKMPAKSQLNYTPGASGIEVEWVIEGRMEMPLIGPFFAKFADRLIGAMFEQGLNKLKSVCEAAK